MQAANLGVQLHSKVWPFRGLQRASGDGGKIIRQRHVVALGGLAQAPPRGIFELNDDAPRHAWAACVTGMVAMMTSRMRLLTPRYYVA